MVALILGEFIDIPIENLEPRQQLEVLRMISYLCKIDWIIVGELPTLKGIENGK